jgi:nucleoside-diphosphate-sugar epimerase
MLITSRKVLVTGGGGFLGKAIVKKLLERGDQVSSFSRGNYVDLARLKVEQIQGDLDDKNAVSAACQGKDIVFHVAAKAGVWGPFHEYFQANVKGTQNVIAACRKHGVPYLVHTSSPSVIYNNKGSMEGVDESAAYPSTFQTAYQQTKARAEQMVVAASHGQFRTIILRPHLIWGPGDNHLAPGILARAGKIMMVGDGKNRVDTIYIDNAADAHLQAGDALQANHDLAGRIYFISQGEPVRQWDMINAILEAGNKPLVTKAISRRTAFLLGAILELIHKTFSLKSEPRMTRFLSHELSTSHWFDISAARKDWGFNPRVTTEEGLKKLKEWLEENHYATD